MEMYSAGTLNVSKKTCDKNPHTKVASDCKEKKSESTSAALTLFDLGLRGASVSNTGCWWKEREGGGGY